MPRKGRELEELVSLLEQTLLPGNAKVTSPAFLIDRTTGERREVDVCVRLPVGSVEVVVILECRDRHAVQDVTWIEQLAQKRNDVLASRAVAVSASGFSEGATRKARFHGIDLRSFEDLDPEAVAELFRINGFLLSLGRTLIHGANLTLDGHSLLGEERPESFNVHLTESCFYSSHEDRWYSLQEIWDLAQNQWDVHAKNSDGNRIRGIFDIATKDREHRFRIHKQSFSALVDSFHFDAEVWLERKEVPLHRVFSYQSDEERLVATQEYVISIDGTDEVMSIHKDLRTDSLSISRRPLSGSSQDLRPGWIRMTQKPPRGLREGRE